MFKKWSVSVEILLYKLAFTLQCNVTSKTRQRLSALLLRSPMYVAPPSQLQPCVLAAVPLVSETEKNGCVSQLCSSWQVYQGCLHQGPQIWLNTTGFRNKSPLRMDQNLYQLRLNQHETHQSEPKPGVQVQMTGEGPDVYGQVKTERSGHRGHCRRPANTCTEAHFPSILLP